LPQFRKNGRISSLTATKEGIKKKKRTKKEVFSRIFAGTHAYHRCCYFVQIKEQLKKIDELTKLACSILPQAEVCTPKTEDK